MQTHTHTHHTRVCVCVCVYTYLSLCVCVCVCVCNMFKCIILVDKIKFWGKLYKHNVTVSSYSKKHRTSTVKQYGEATK